MKKMKLTNTYTFDEKKHIHLLRDIRSRVSLAVRRGAPFLDIQEAVKNGMGGTKKPLTNYKHGGKGTRLYSIWKGMRKRCLNAKAEAYPNYGGRGINICKEWGDFKVFREWALSHGYTEDLTIERVDVNSNYEPSNCAWIPFAEQWKNRRVPTYKRKLSQGDIFEIRWMKESDISPKEMASYFNVSLTTVYNYV